MEKRAGIRMRGWKLVVAACCLVWSSPGSMRAQTASAIKSSPAYVWGEGKGETLRAADQAALTELLNQISVSLSSEVSTQVFNEQAGQEVRSLVEYRNVMKTYSSATLNNTSRIVLSEEPEAHVFRFVKKEEVDKIFALRIEKVKEMVKIANNAYARLSLGNALRYYYWANALLQSTRYPNEVEVFDASGTPCRASVWIPGRINEIFDGLSASITGQSAGEENVYEVAFRFRGKPVADIDYTYFDGTDWSCVHSAQDGLGTVELRPTYRPQQVPLKYEYQYYGESQSDKEVAQVLEAVKEIRFPKSARPVSLGKQAETVPPVRQTVSAAAANHAATSVGTAEEASCREAMQQVMAAIRTRNYASVRNVFTPDGYNVFDRLIHYGQARLLGEPELVYSRSGDGICCRSVPMSFSFSRDRRFTEEVVFFFNAEGQIDNVAFGLGKVGTQDILEKTGWENDVKEILVSFLENYKTAYALKRIDYIEDIFADDALIITGKVVERLGGDQETGYRQNRFVKLTRQDKSTYLRNLRNVFAGNEFINIRFADNTVKKMGKGGEVYSIQIKQDYFSANYGDSGYLFIMVDVNNPARPVIHVRAWQENPDPEWGIVGPEMF